MKLSNSKVLDRHLTTLKKRSPWMCSLIRHCLETQNPKSVEAMRMLLTRLRLNAV
jgi:hypothetical protein